MKARAKSIAKYYNQCTLPKWATMLGVVLLAFSIVAAGVTAIFYDKYLSLGGAWESALTNVWFIAFIAVVYIGAFLSLGYPMLSAIGALIWVLFSKPEPDLAEVKPSAGAPVVVESAPVIEEKASVVEQPEQVVIDTDCLRVIFDSKYMCSWSNKSSKMFVDRVIKDLQIVLNNYERGTTDKEHYSNKSVLKIEEILHKDKYLKKVPNSYIGWCSTLFECLLIAAPDKQNIKNEHSPSEKVKQRFYYYFS